MRYGVRWPGLSSGWAFHDNRLMPEYDAFLRRMAFFVQTCTLGRLICQFYTCGSLRHLFGDAYF
jgi:hypothetical protein